MYSLGCLGQGVLISWGGGNISVKLYSTLVFTILGLDFSNFSITIPLALQ